MSIVSVDNIQPVGSGTSVTVNSAATLVVGNVNSSGVVTATSFSGDGSGLTSVGTGELISKGNTKAQVVDTGSDGHFKVETEGTERFSIISNGYVGIGTTNPLGVNAVDANNTATLAVGILTAREIFGPVTGALTPTGDVNVPGNLDVDGATTVDGLTSSENMTISRDGDATFTVETSAGSGDDSLIKIRGARTNSTTANIAMLQFDNKTSQNYTMAQISAKDPAGAHSQG